MKLNNQQIDALIAKANSKRSEQIKKARQKAIESKQADTERLAKSVEKEISSLSKEAVRAIADNKYNFTKGKKPLGINWIVKSIENAISNGTKVPNLIDDRKLRNEIVLASINSNDLEELCKKLKIEI